MMSLACRKTVLIAKIAHFSSGCFSIWTFKLTTQLYKSNFRFIFTAFYAQFSTANFL